MKALTNLASNLQLLDLIKDKREPTMDAIEFGWMDTYALVRYAMEHERVDKLDKESMHDLIRELALRLDNMLYQFDED